MDAAVSQQAETASEQVRRLARKALAQLEAAMDEVLPDSEPEASLRQKAHDYRFGAKTSHVATLISLGELLLKLEKQDAPAGAPAAPQVASAADLVLVEHFLRRMERAHEG